MEYKIEDLTKEEAAYIGAAINEIVPHKVDADEEEFILKVENENGEIVGGRNRGRGQGRLRLCGRALCGGSAPTSGPGHGSFEGGGGLHKGKRRVHDPDDRGRLERRILQKEWLSAQRRAQGRAERPRLLRTLQEYLKQSSSHFYSCCCPKAA